MSVEEIKHQMEQQKRKFEAFEAGRKKVFEDRMSGYRIALQFEARRIAKARELEERTSRRNQVEDDEFEDVEPSAWREEGEEEEAPQLAPAEDSEPAESMMHKPPEDRATRSENESVPQQTRDLEPGAKGPRPRTVYISEQEKDHLQSRFGHTVCDNCAIAQHPCSWPFTGSSWACEQCNARKTRCTVNKVGIWDRRDQWIAAIRNEKGAVAIRTERGPSKDARRAAENVVIATPKGRNKPTRETGNNEEAFHSLGSTTLLPRIAELLDLNNKLLKRLVNLGEENNRIIRTLYKHKDPNGSGGGHLGVSEIGVSRHMQPVELDFLGENEF
ncbi:hypothetical protein FRC19_011560 [Serendipita sp. 401]|nr:hypothetical protein FRC19_011560 [Serendipita sp. 401]KAG9058209.1 hypothetical protein FS842_000150 [Serendipita sp. 407]